MSIKRDDVTESDKADKHTRAADNKRRKGRVK